MLFLPAKTYLKKFCSLSALAKACRLGIAFLISLILSAFWTLPTYAHAADLAVAHLRVQPQETIINLALPTSLVAFADDDRNSRLSSQEITHHAQELQDFFGKHLNLSDSQGQKGTVSVKAAGKLLLSPTLLGNDTHSTLSLTYAWSRPLDKLKVNYDLFNNLPNAHCLASIFKNGELENYIFTPNRPNLEIELHKGQKQIFSGASAIAIAVAFLWGATHALSPGHGKTLVAAYLVGSRANAKDAILLGLTTTLTHTVGVFALGVITLFASRYLLPAKFFPWLNLLSGLMVVIFGFILLRNRLRSKTKETSHHHHHPHTHTHSHFHHHHHSHTHSHAHHHHHSHLPTSTKERVTWRIVTLGIAGGLVPCPAALVLLLSTIASGRVGFGLLLVSVFSLGLAVTLTGLGLLLVTTKTFFQRFPTPIKTTKTLSIISAILILLVGSGLTYEAISQILSSTVPVV
jgi:ABC-type nickel/cobalt efflux system permease component RcnA